MSDTDVRDEAIRRLLDGAVSWIEPAPRLDGVLRRGGRRRVVRAIAAATAVAMFAGAIVWAGLEFRGEGVVPGAPAPSVSFGALAENGWTVSYPGNWRLTPVNDCGVGRYRGGFVVANTDFVFRDRDGNPPGCEDHLVTDGFPEDGVGAYLMPAGSHFLTARVKNTVFPMSLDDFVRNIGERREPITPPEFYEDIHVHHGFRAILWVWIGEKATAANRAALADLVWSLRYRGADLGMGFAPADGWRTRTHLNRSPQDMLPTTASASNVRFTFKGGKFLWDTSLPPNGIRIIAWFVGKDRSGTPSPNFPPAELPLRIPEDLADSWEGYPDPTGALRRANIWVQVNGWDLQVWVLFGSDPSQEMRDAAQAELNRLFVPPERHQPSP